MIIDSYAALYFIGIIIVIFTHVMLFSSMTIHSVANLTAAGFIATYFMNKEKIVSLLG